MKFETKRKRRFLKLETKREKIFEVRNEVKEKSK